MSKPTALYHAIGLTSLFLFMPQHIPKHSDLRTHFPHASLPVLAELCWSFLLTSQVRSMWPQPVARTSPNLTPGGLSARMALTSLQPAHHLRNRLQPPNIPSQSSSMQNTAEITLLSMEEVHLRAPLCSDLTSPHLLTGTFSIVSVPLTDSAHTFYLPLSRGVPAVPTTETSLPPASIPEKPTRLQGSSNATFFWLTRWLCLVPLQNPSAKCLCPSCSVLGTLCTLVGCSRKAACLNTSAPWDADCILFVCESMCPVINKVQEMKSRNSAWINANFFPEGSFLAGI